MASIKESCTVLMGCAECTKLYGGVCEELKREEEAYQYGGICDELKQAEEAEDFSDEDDGFADEPKGVAIKVTDDLSPIDAPLFVAVPRILVGTALDYGLVDIDDGWWLARGTVNQITEEIQNICGNITKMGFIAVPQDGTICCINTDAIYKIEFKLEDA